MIRSLIVDGLGTTTTGLHHCWHGLGRIVTQPGRHDLFASVCLTGGLLAPLWTTPVAAQIGVSDAGAVLCSGALNIAQLLTVGLGLVSMYFILKGLIRMMVGLDNAGATELVGSDGRRRTDDAGPYGRRQARGGVYSVMAALLPVIVPIFLKVAGIDVVTCLFP